MQLWRHYNACVLAIIVGLSLTALQGCTEKSDKRHTSTTTNAAPVKEKDAASADDTSGARNSVIADLTARKSDAATGCLIPASIDEFPVVASLGPSKTGWDGVSPLTSAKFNVIAIE